MPHITLHIIYFGRPWNSVHLTTWKNFGWKDLLAVLHSAPSLVPTCHVGSPTRPVGRLCDTASALPHAPGSLLCRVPSPQGVRWPDMSALGQQGGPSGWKLLSRLWPYTLHLTLFPGSLHLSCLWPSGENMESLEANRGPSTGSPPLPCASRPCPLPLAPHWDTRDHLPCLPLLLQCTCFPCRASASFLLLVHLPSSGASRKTRDTLRGVRVKLLLT